MYELDILLQVPLTILLPPPPSVWMQLQIPATIAPWLEKGPVLLRRFLAPPTITLPVPLLIVCRQPPPIKLKYS